MGMARREIVMTKNEIREKTLNIDNMADGEFYLAFIGYRNSDEDLNIDLVSVQEGTGDNLLPDDRAEGYVDYIDYTAFTFDGAFKDGDGGMIMLKNPYSELSCEEIIGLILDELEIKHEIYCILCLKEAPVTRTYRVYGREGGHRQKISFDPSVTWNFSDKYEGIRILTIRNSDVTGTNDYTEVAVTRNNADECAYEISGQISDGLFEDCYTGDVVEV